MIRSTPPFLIVLLSLLLALPVVAVDRVDVDDPESELVVSAYRSGVLELGGSAYRIDSDSRIYNEAGQAVTVAPGDRVVIVAVVQEERGLPLLRELLVRRAR